MDGNPQGRANIGIGMLYDIHLLKSFSLLFSVLYSENFLPGYGVSLFGIGYFHISPKEHARLYLPCS